ncbi:glutathione S-transferase family protein [Pikeienuella piscinae]|uniref:Glutathione S-transferase family protein n=1 Tax=Pikeienuella piscinae TaxID=2748098 RepID=A0A7M3T691_9RHOB|nr:glutathione S-transferase family protein [Pikeienuella piscinae]QIE57522.1 glutathione S-transferase family protein [Pikeienuella piscinae]
MPKLYDSKFSGNAWKVRILLSRLAIPYERITLDLAKGEAKEPGFAAKSRFQRVPALELDDGRCIVESCAMMLYLAEGSDLLPADPVARADVVSWLFFEQADLTKPLAIPRFFHLRGIAGEMAARIAALQEQGYPALDKLEAWIAPREWLSEGRCTLADLGVYPYVALAHEGGYDMSRYPGIGAWLKRVEAEPGWAPLIEEGAR